MSPRRSSAARVEPSVSPVDGYTDLETQARVQAALLAEMNELGITAADLFEVAVDVDVNELCRWLETGEGPEPGKAR
jgi:hypothetical protein